MGSSGKVPSAPPNQYTGMGQANTAALSGMQSMQEAPNYAQTLYNAYGGGLAGMLGATSYNPQQNVNIGNYLSGQGQNMFGQGSALMDMGLDPQNALYNRSFQQQQEQTRAGQAARGILTSPAGAALESQANQTFNEQWRNQQAARAAQMASAAQGMYGAGLSNMLGGGGLNASTAQQQLQGLGSLQAAGLMSNLLPQQNIQNWLNYLGAGSQAQNQAYQNQVQAYQAKQSADQGTASGIGSMAGMAMMAMMMMSDVRYKRDIKYAYTRDDGINVYNFRYLDSPEYHTGVMAQEVRDVKPEAVRDINGVLYVNYSMLGL